MQKLRCKLDGYLGMYAEANKESLERYILHPPAVK